MSSHSLPSIDGIRRPQPVRPVEPKRPKIPVRPLVIGAGALLVLIGLILVLRLWLVSPNPVPGYILSSAPFTIYYPEQKKLPAGYSLDKKSFRQAQPGVILFWLTSADSQRLVFSEEQQPDSHVIAQFTANSIPLHTEVTTVLGKADIGAIGSGTSLQTIVSLPVKDGPWLIITAPANTPLSVLDKIIQALTN